MRVLAKPCVAAAITAALLLAPAARARELTFGDVALPASGVLPFGSTFTTQAYRFGCEELSPADADGVCESLTVFGADYADSDARGEQALFNNNFAGATTLERVDGGAFELQAWRVAPFFDAPDPAAEPIDLIAEGTRVGGGLVTQTFSVLLGASGYQLFTFGDAFRGVVGVRWRADGFAPGFFSNAEQIASVTVVSSATAVVSEPGTLVLVAGALVVVGVTRRRRRIG